MLPIVTASNNASTSFALPPNPFVVSDRYSVFTTSVNAPELLAISPEPSVAKASQA